MSMEYFNWNMHDDINQLYQDQRQEKWEPVKLISTIQDALGRYNSFISDIEILEDYTNHQTIIKIVINEHKYLMEKITNVEFNLEKLIKELICNRVTMLRPSIIIDIE